MSEESREQILSVFQDCTGLEDVEECIHILDDHQWNLINALQSVHERIGGAGGGGGGSGGGGGGGGGNVDDTESTVPVQQIINPNTISNKRQSDSIDQDQSRTIKTIPGGNQRIATIVNNGPVRDLHFTIEYCDKTEKIIVFDNESVYQLRLKILEKFHIPPQTQHFLNWTMMSYDDQTLLKDLNLPNENIIRLSSIENGSTTQIYNHTTSSDEYPITVLCEDKSGSYIPQKLVLQSNTTINEMKKQIENLAHIPIKQQNWQGLSDAKDSDKLYETSITSHSTLVVQQLDTTLNQQLPIINRHIKHSIVTSVEQHDDEHMEIDHGNGLESLDDDENHVSSHNNSITTITSTPSNSDREPFIPDDCTDDISALENFSRVFHMRYHSTGPILYIGSLDDAIQESLHSSIHDRRPLAIYLHNDQSICANVFCSQTLATDSIIEYLANNYVVWAWDVTTDINKAKLFETLRRCVGNQCVQRVGLMDNDIFPLILIVIRSRATLELITIIEGKSTPSEVLSNLIQSHESFEQQRLRDFDEELMREKRENLKKQQEDEYEQSRQADLAKERARQEEQDTNERLKQYRLQQQQESKARLPDEPNETDKNITRLKIRLPDDEGVLIRRFRIDDNLQVLFDYLTSEGRMIGEYKLLTTYPKRDLTSVDQSNTFEQLKLYPQEQLILESL